jgi:iron(II)-dependent oxidoreductase
MTDAERHLRTPLIFDDEPVAGGETTHFQFDAYAETLARLIAAKTTRTPLTIGVFGEWGTGKTTLLRAIQARLDETEKLGREPISFLGSTEHDGYRRCRTVWFNAWRYGRENEILAALVEAILRQMRDDGFIHELYAALSDPTGPHLRVVDATLSFASQLLSGGKVDLDLSKFRVESQFREHLPFLDEFQRVFDQLLLWYLRLRVQGKLNLEEAHRDERRKLDQQGVLAIFIDDLDRCLPAKTVQVLEAIKLMVGQPGTVFVLGASERAVQRAIQVHYEEKEKAKEGTDHQRYLEKLIQVRFDLPPIRENDVQSFVEGLHHGRLDETLRENLLLIVKGVPTNPRRIKTFVNYVELRWALLVNSRQAEGLDRAVLTRWLVLDAAERSFTDFVRQLPLQERPIFVQNARRFALGEEIDAPTEEYERKWPKERYKRLWDVLKQEDFAFEVSAETVDKLIYLSAPPVEAQAEPQEEAPAPRPPRDRAEKASIRAEQAKALRPELAGGLLPDLVRIPAGAFLMGSKEDDAPADDDEKPQHECTIPYAYRIGRYPVTVAEFACFVEAEGYQSGTFWTEAGWQWVQETKRTGPERYGDPFDQPDHPVVGVSWHEAAAYCRWLTQRLRDLEDEELGEGVVRLPSEAEWEKAARGEHGRQWPWGDKFDRAKANTAEGGLGHTAAVGAYSPAGDSPYGCADMAGNVWEWTHSLHKSYPYEAADGRETLDDKGPRVLRGGSFLNDGGLVRCAYRDWIGPDGWFYVRGFRVVVAPGLPLASGSSGL